MVIILLSFNTANKVFRNTCICTHIHAHTHKQVYSYNKPHATALFQLSFIIFDYHQYAIDSNLLPYLTYNCAVSGFQFLSYFFFFWAMVQFFCFQMKSYINIQSKKICAMETEQKIKFSILKPLCLVPSAQH